MFQSAFPALEFEKGNDPDETDSHDGQVEIKDPAPGIYLGEGTANQWTRHATDGPDDTDESEVVASLAERHHVGDDDFRDGDDASPSSTLDGTADKHLGEILGYRADDGADGEAGQGKEKEGATTP